MQTTHSSLDMDDTNRQGLSRRRFLGLCAGGVAGMMLKPSYAAIQAEEKAINLHNLHTGESLKQVYWAEGQYQQDALAQINKLLRDHRTGEIQPIDPQLLDVLHNLHENMDGKQAFHIISGYRSPKTNSMLRGNSNGVAKKSLHMQGKAIDLRLPGSDLKQLHKAARSLRAGGVGYYAKSGFIHVDTGRVRYW
ncbi:MAG: DUF882 domain-containing protein [Chromatiales bacterium]|jgi:uncharacterized protein YcbK (DUF882 family)